MWIWKSAIITIIIIMMWKMQPTFWIVSAVHWNATQPGGQNNRFYLPREQIKSFVLSSRCVFFDVTIIGVYKNAKTCQDLCLISIILKAILSFVHIWIVMIVSNNNARIVTCTLRLLCKNYSMVFYKLICQILPTFTLWSCYIISNPFNIHEFKRTSKVTMILNVRSPFSWIENYEEIWKEQPLHYTIHIGL